MKSDLLYGSETWRIIEDINRRINAIDIDVFRKSLSITYCVSFNEKTNDEVRQQMGLKEPLNKEVESQQLVWYGTCNEWTTQDFIKEWWSRYHYIKEREEDQGRHKLTKIHDLQRS